MCYCGIFSNYQAVTVELWTTSWCGHAESGCILFCLRLTTDETFVADLLHNFVAQQQVAGLPLVVAERVHKKSLEQFDCLSSALPFKKWNILLRAAVFVNSSDMIQIT